MSEVRISHSAVVVLLSLPLCGWVSAAGQTSAGSNKVLQFPDTAVGIIQVRPAKSGHYGWYGDIYGGWESPQEAVGAVTVPDDCHVRLEISRDASTDLRFLDALAPDDVQYLSLGGTDVTDRQVRHVRRLTGLRLLNLEQTRITDSAALSFQDLDQLQHLNLSAFGVDRTGFGVGDGALVVAAQLPALETLRLRRTKISDDGIETLALSESLVSLSISGTQITDAGVAHLRNLKTLRSLRLGVYEEGIPVTDDGMKFVSEMPQLVHLDLSGTEISGEGLSHLKNLTNLESLSIDETKIRNEDLRHLAPLKSLSRIRAYDLNRRDIDDEGAIHLTKLPSLKRITAHFDVSDTGIKALTSIPKLETLDLDGDGHEMSEESMTSIFKMRNLKTLQLTDFKLRSDNLKDLSALQSLEDFSITGAAIDAKAFEQLRRLPNLKILRLYYNEMIPGVVEKPKLTGLEKLMQLKRLDIKGRNIEVSELQIIGKLSSLEDLDIGGEIVVNDAVAQQLGKLNSLRSLRVETSSITDDGLQALSALKNLRYLTISCLATKAGLDAIRPMTSLRSLQMSYPSIIAADVEALAEKMPSLQDINAFEFRDDPEALQAN